LQSIVEGAFSGPTINRTAFPNTPAGFFWTSTPYAGSSDYAWFVNFGNGFSGNDNVGYSFGVRCVHAATGLSGVIGICGASETTDGGGGAVVLDAADAQQGIPTIGTGGSVDGPTGSGGITGTTGTGATTSTGGTTASGGSNGGASGSGSLPASCVGLTATCGPAGESCCMSLLVPGGTFYRSYDGVVDTDEGYPATVADYYLDKYEITVGRFRQFLDAGMGTQGNPPAAGAGAHPLIMGSGWDSTWNTNLPANTTVLKVALNCGGGAFQTWTDTAGENETMPMSCVDWYMAFAFCAWDGGRLPTEAEWNYAASGGNEQRYYPWSSPANSTAIDNSYAVYCGVSCGATQNVGSKSPKGDGKWGQSDLAGNLLEWTLDWQVTPYSTPCTNCAQLTDTLAPVRAARGGYVLDFASDLRSASRFGYGPGALLDAVGARCARTSP
jgi:formylglycine-generating enzyme required for sulfatase activity